MRIAVIGAGRVGGTLGRRWAEAGHAVVFGVRDPIAGTPLPGATRMAAVRDAGTGADVVVLATPWAAVPEALAALGAAEGALDGVTLVDATNPIAPGLRLQGDAEGRSGAERVQQWVPDARVVKAFNTTGVENMANPRYGEHTAAMLYAGDHADAKARVRTLAEDLGFEAFDAGPLARARELEHLALVWIGLATGAGGAPAQGRGIAFGLLRR